CSRDSDPGKDSDHRTPSIGRRAPAVRRRLLQKTSSALQHPDLVQYKPQDGLRVAGAQTVDGLFDVRDIVHPYQPPYIEDLIRSHPPKTRREALHVRAGLTHWVS